MEAAKIEPASCEVNRRLKRRWPSGVLVEMRFAHGDSGCSQLSLFQEGKSDVGNAAEFSGGFNSCLRFLFFLLFKNGRFEQEQTERTEKERMSDGDL